MAAELTATRDTWIDRMSAVLQDRLELTPDIARLIALEQLSEVAKASGWEPESDEGAGLGRAIAGNWARGRPQ